MIQGLILGLIGGLINWFSLRKRLEACRVSEAGLAVDTFTHKGKAYDKNQYINLKAGQLADQRAKDLGKELNRYYSDIDKGKARKYTELDLMDIKATEAALYKMNS